MGIEIKLTNPQTTVIQVTIKGPKTELSDLLNDIKRRINAQNISEYSAKLLGDPTLIKLDECELKEDERTTTLILKTKSGTYQSKITGRPLPCLDINSAFFLVTYLNSYFALLAGTIVPSSDPSLQNLQEKDLFTAVQNNWEGHSHTRNAQCNDDGSPRYDLITTALAVLLGTASRVAGNIKKFPTSNNTVVKPEESKQDNDYPNTQTIMLGKKNIATKQGEQTIVEFFTSLDPERSAADDITNAIFILYQFSKMGIAPNIKDKETEEKETQPPSDRERMAANYGEILEVLQDTDLQTYINTFIDEKLKQHLLASQEYERVSAFAKSILTPLPIQLTPRLTASAAQPLTRSDSSPRDGVSRPSVLIVNATSLPAVKRIMALESNVISENAQTLNIVDFFKNLRAYKFEGEKVLKTIFILFMYKNFKPTQINAATPNFEKMESVYQQAIAAIKTPGVSSYIKDNLQIFALLKTNNYAEGSEGYQFVQGLLESPTQTTSATTTLVADDKEEKIYTEAILPKLVWQNDVIDGYTHSAPITTTIQYELFDQLIVAKSIQDCKIYELGQGQKIIRANGETAKLICDDMRDKAICHGTKDWLDGITTMIVTSLRELNDKNRLGIVLACLGNEQQKANMHLPALAGEINILEFFKNFEKHKENLEGVLDVILILCSYRTMRMDKQITKRTPDYSIINANYEAAKDLLGQQRNYIQEKFSEFKKLISQRNYTADTITDIEEYLHEKCGTPKPTAKPTHRKNFSISRTFSKFGRTPSTSSHGSASSASTSARPNSPPPAARAASPSPQSSSKAAAASTGPRPALDRPATSPASSSNLNSSSHYMSFSPPASSALSFQSSSSMLATSPTNRSPIAAATDSAIFATPASFSPTHEVRLASEEKQDKYTKRDLPILKFVELKLSTIANGVEYKLISQALSDKQINFWQRIARSTTTKNWSITSKQGKTFIRIDKETTGQTCNRLQQTAIDSPQQLDALFAPLQSSVRAVSPAPGSSQHHRARTQFTANVLASMNPPTDDSKQNAEEESFKTFSKEYMRTGQIQISTGTVNILDYFSALPTQAGDSTEVNLADLALVIKVLFSYRSMKQDDGTLGNSPNLAAMDGLYEKSKSNLLTKKNFIESKLDQIKQLCFPNEGAAQLVLRTSLVKFLTHILNPGQAKHHRAKTAGAGIAADSANAAQADEEDIILLMRGALYLNKIIPNLSTRMSIVDFFQGLPKNDNATREHITKSLLVLFSYKKMKDDGKITKTTAHYAEMEKTYETITKLLQTEDSPPQPTAIATHIIFKLKFLDHIKNPGVLNNEFAIEITNFIKALLGLVQKTAAASTPEKNTEVSPLLLVELSDKKTKVNILVYLKNLPDSTDVNWKDFILVMACLKKYTDLTPNSRGSVIEEKAGENVEQEMQGIYVKAMALIKEQARKDFICNKMPELMDSMFGSSNGTIAKIDGNQVALLTFITECVEYKEPSSPKASKPPIEFPDAAIDLSAYTTIDTPDGKVNILDLFTALGTQEAVDWGRVSLALDALCYLKNGIAAAKTEPADGDQSPSEQSRFQAKEQVYKNAVALIQTLMRAKFINQNISTLQQAVNKAKEDDGLITTPEEIMGLIQELAPPADDEFELPNNNDHEASLQTGTTSSASSPSVLTSTKSPGTTSITVFGFQPAPATLAAFTANSSSSSSSAASQQLRSSLADISDLGLQSPPRVVVASPSSTNSTAMPFNLDSTSSSSSSNRSSGSSDGETKMGVTEQPAQLTPLETLVKEAMLKDTIKIGPAKVNIINFIQQLSSNKRSLMREQFITNLATVILYVAVYDVRKDRMKLSSTDSKKVEDQRKEIVDCFFGTDVREASNIKLRKEIIAEAKQDIKAYLKPTTNNKIPLNAYENYQVDAFIDNLSAATQVAVPRRLDVGAAYNPQRP